MKACWAAINYRRHWAARRDWPIRSSAGSNGDRMQKTARTRLSRGRIKSNKTRRELSSPTNAAARYAPSEWAVLSAELTRNELGWPSDGRQLQVTGGHCDADRQPDRPPDGQTNRRTGKGKKAKRCKGADRASSVSVYTLAEPAADAPDASKQQIDV